jgi:hypothetical protein
MDARGSPFVTFFPPSPYHPPFDLIVQPRAELERIKLARYRQFRAHGPNSDPTALFYYLALLTGVTRRELIAAFAPGSFRLPQRNNDTAMTRRAVAT